jgi:hypothetical protein
VFEEMSQPWHVNRVEQTADAHIDGGRSLVGFRVGHEHRAEAVWQRQEAVVKVVGARLDERRRSGGSSGGLVLLPRQRRGGHDGAARL